MTDEKKPPLSRPIDDSVPEETPSLLERDVKLDRRAQVPSFAELQGTQRASAPPGLQPRAPARPPTGAPGAVAPAVQLRPPVATTTAAVGTPMLPDADPADATVTGMPRPPTPRPPPAAVKPPARPVGSPVQELITTQPYAIPGKPPVSPEAMGRKPATAAPPPVAARPPPPVAAAAPAPPVAAPAALPVAAPAPRPQVAQPAVAAPAPAPQRPPTRPAAAAPPAPRPPTPVAQPAAPAPARPASAPGKPRVVPLRDLSRPVSPVEPTIPVTPAFADAPLPERPAARRVDPMSAPELGDVPTDPGSIPIGASQASPTRSMRRGGAPVEDAPTDPGRRAASAPLPSVEDGPLRDREPPTMAGQPVFGAVEALEVVARPAPLWRRLGALVVDTTVLVLVVLLVGSALAAARAPAPPAGLSALGALAFKFEAVAVPLAAAAAAFALLYATLFARLMGGATVGRKLLGLRLVDRTGRPPSFVRAAVRAVLATLSFALGLFGFWLGLVDRRGQSLHDKLVRTFVVRLSG